MQISSFYLEDAAEATYSLSKFIIFNTQFIIWNAKFAYKDHC